MASTLFTSFTRSRLRPTTANLSVRRRNTANIATDRTAGLRFSGHISVGRSSLYEVLGILTTASCREIKAAYRKLARTCHPDVTADNSAGEFIKIQAAYSTLSDPDKKADYDKELIYRAQLLSVSCLPSRTPALGYSGNYTRRNWESDQCW